MLRSREEIVRSLTDNQFDFIIKDSNLFAAFTCYNLAIKGHKVALCQSFDFDREDNFQVTTIFPGSIKELLKARKKLATMEALRKSFPHLVLQQRALNIGMPRCRSVILHSLFNLIAAKDLHQQSMLVELRKFPEFKHLAAAGFKTAILSREYKVNLNRLIIELLKEAERAGAMIANYIDVRLNGDRITFKDQISGTNGNIHSKKFSEAEKKPARSVNKNFEEYERMNNPLRIFGRFADYQISFSKNEITSVKAISDLRHSDPTLSGRAKETILLQKAIQAIDENDMNFLLSFRSTESGQKYSNHLPSKRVEDFHDKIANLFLKGTSIVFPGKSLSWIENGYELNHLSSVADKLFDEARQTGIDQERFLELFYRFGSQIREITDIAYEKPAGEDANAGQHWDAAVNRFEGTTEWKQKKLI